MGKSKAGESEKVTGFQLRDTPLVATPIDIRSNEVISEKSKSSADLDNLGELPHSYGSDTIFLIAQEPHWLFTYWDIDISRHPGGQAHLRVYEGDDQLESEIEVPFETRNWYIPVKSAGSFYTVEIGYYRGAGWKPIARSAPVATPRDKVSESEDFDYASIPLHISFQKLTEHLQAAVRSGESLIQALARLQRDGQFDENTPGAYPQLALTQRMVLEALLGKDLLEELTSGGQNPQQIETRIEAYLKEKLSSGGASEAFGSEFLRASALSSLGLFSGFGGFSSEQPSSWNLAAITSWASGALASWQEAAGGPGSSWSAPSSWTGVESSSWGLETLTSWSQGALSSVGLAGTSSWPQAISSSWFQAVQSSWIGAAGISSWNQAALTSWSQAALSSWSGGASESLSSFGVPAPERGFFMNVNAEVIFYGGTDPQASVTIDGKPIKLNSDGTFRYHFVFPNGSYEIPIVATSPDGVETRSAILRFDRATQKVSQVDDTAQPPLGAPMGSKL